MSHSLTLQETLRELMGKGEDEEEEATKGNKPKQEENRVIEMASYKEGLDN
uniref:Uncharacterized protein n=1 Tax=Rhizophora mucronata TaxID=61149 RepID=A0A2P2R3U6_RHIMU